MQAHGDTGSGGRRRGSVRAGETVRRAAGPWPPAVHALLEHLAASGFEGAPRVVDVDAERQEVLQHVEGDTVGGRVPYPDWAWDDDTLVQVARLMRRYHGVAAGFRPNGPLTWRFAEAALGPAEVVCHNDVAPTTVVRRDGQVVALLDWDLAVPAPPEWDLAHAAWQFVPLHAPGMATRLGFAPAGECPDAARARRLRLLADEYGLVRREGFVELVRARVEVVRASLRETASDDGSVDGSDGRTHGREEFVRLAAGGCEEDCQRTLRYLDDIGDLCEQALLAR